MTGTSKEFIPIEENHLVYKRLYSLYKQLHDSFGTKDWNGNMFNVMKDLLNIRDEVRRKRNA
jgi:L-ribulokinase